MLKTLAFLAIGAWFLFGSPKNDLADWFYPDEPAPWEKVDLFYYPRANNLNKVEEYRNVGSLRDCQSRAYFLRTRPNLPPGDYECAVGDTGQRLGDIKIYRLTLK